MTVTNLALDLAFILLLSLIPVVVSYFLDFCLGTPGHEQPNPHAIFYGWTLFLAKKRLNNTRIGCDKSATLYSETSDGYFEMINSANKIVSNNAKLQLRVALVKTAREFYTWEHAAGFCIYCTNVWICGLYSGLVLWLFNPVLFVVPIYFLPLLTIFFSHLLLRKINS